MMFTLTFVVPALAAFAVCALLLAFVFAGRGTTPPPGNSIYAQTIETVPGEVRETVINYLGPRLDSPMCNVHDVTEADPDGSLRYRLTIRSNPDGRHQRPERRKAW